MSERLSFFATCAPGLEAVLHEEVRALRMARVERQVGGVYFEGNLRSAWHANLALRTAIRVLMRVRRFRCEDEDALYEGVREVDWGRFLAADGCLVVDAHCTESKLDHTRFVEQRVKDAVVDQFREQGGTRPDVDRENADLGLYVHLYRDRCTLLADTSGRSLHVRGWRKEQGRAPLAETLAAALVKLSGWDGRSPLLDPFCGSGTVLIEAALMAKGIQPGSFREGFGFERWRGHDARAFAAARAQLCGTAGPAGKRTIVGMDVDAKRVEEARANAEGAGVGELVRFEVADAREFAPRPGWNAWVVSNLPYGKRIEADVRDLYQAFGRQLADCDGYHAALLCLAEPAAAQALGIDEAAPSTGVFPVINGGLECQILTTRIGS